MKITRGQMTALCAIALLSPALRLYPSFSAGTAGRAAWLSALLALPLLTVYAFFLCRLPCGLCELAEQGMGRRVGRAVELLLGLWLILEAGFTLRTGAERMILALFPSAPPGLFVVCTGFLGLIAALGSLRSLLRMARMVLPLVLLCLAPVLLFALRGIDWGELWPLAPGDLPGAVRGMYPVVDVLSFGLYLPWLLLPRGLPPGNRLRDWLLWLGGMSLLLLDLCVSVLGRFGPELTARLSLPFFTLVRNLVFFRTLERLEALVVALWIFPDFLMTSALLYGAQRCLRRSLGLEESLFLPKRTDWKDGRWLIPVCSLAAVGLGLILGPDQTSLETWSQRIIPVCNLAVAFGLVPILYIVGIRRKKQRAP